MNAPADDDLVLTAIGLMSGTSMDGIDAALIRTDGKDQVEVGATLTLPYRPGLRTRLQKLVMSGAADKGEARILGRDLTLAHVEVVQQLLSAAGTTAGAIDLLGFHGHTVKHAPAERFTWQIGDPTLLAHRTGIPVVANFRLADVAAGGQGAPLVPIYHAARAARLERPVAVLNIGGVANITWLEPPQGSRFDEGVLAFDCGPGNALIDDFVLARTGHAFDASGSLSLAGVVNRDVLGRLMNNAYFDQAPPKSLDRNAFDASEVAKLSTPDGAATLAAFTVAAAIKGLVGVGTPKRLLVCGGGRLNRAMMAGLADGLPGVAVAPVEAVGWRGDALEAEAFGYLAVRSFKGLPYSFPSTTGAPKPMTGGIFYPSPTRIKAAS